MAGPNVFIKTYDDLELLKGCVASIPDDCLEFVLDGRYADFPGDSLRTPGCREWCDEQENVIYMSPRADRLPWGHEHAQAEPQLRWPVHDQARFANYEMLPQEEWVLHLDADERIEVFDVDVDTLDPKRKYVPHIDVLAERNHFVPRLYQPRHWTFWIADVMYPREFWGRDTSLEKLQWLHHNSMRHQAINRERLDHRVRIRNVGDDRDPDYLARRAKQLETMGRTDRAEHYRRLLPP